nr:ribosomal protein S4 [Oedogonium sp. HN1801B]
MSRYLGPRLRIVRRLGYLVGLTRKKPSTRLLNPDARRGIRKVLPPGQHGRSKSFKKNPYESNEYDFLIRLKLKQRIRYHYGITEKQLVNYVRQARKIKGSTGRVLLRLLEMRLDNTIFRLHMAPTIRAARQLITHGHIYVNNKKVSIPSYSCKPKDIITPAPKTRSIQLLNNFLTELDLEKSRFRNLLKILKFGKKGLLNNPKILNNNKNITNQKDCKPNTIISLRIQRAGAFEGQGIGFLGRNLVIVQPLFGNIKNYLGKSINICIYLKRENIFYGYPTKPFNVKMRYSKLINSIDAIQYFGRKKINSIKSIETDIKKNSNKPSSAIILMGGANILRNKLNKKNPNFRQNSSDNILVRIEAASCGKNSKSVLNRKRQLNPFLLNKTRDTNPILFREKYLYSRKNKRFIGINHIFYVKMILKSVEQNSNNLLILEQKQPLKNKLRTSINNSFKDNLLYSKLNKSSLNSFKLGQLNTDLSVSKKNSNLTLINPMALENSLKLKKYYLSKLKTSNLFIETKLSFISWCIQKEKSEINVTKSKLTTSPSSINFNKKILKQKLFKNLLSQTVIKKNLNINFFWKAIYLFSKINLTKIDDSQKNIVFKTNFLQKFCKMIFEQQIDFSNNNKNSLFSTKTFLFFSKTFSLINEWKSKILINNTLFDQFLNDIKESISLLILLQKSIVSLLRNKKQFSNFNIKSSLILEYYKNQEFEILRNLQLQIKNKLNVQKFEKLSLNKINKINQFRKIFEVNSIKKEFNFYQSLICNNKLLDFNISDKIDVLTNLNYFLNNKRFINYFSIYENSLKNNKNLIKKNLSKYKFEVQLFLNFFKKTTIFLNSFDSSKLNLFKETENLMRENLFKKQVLQKLNFIKIDLSLKKYLVINILNKLINFNVLSEDQKQQILFQINNSLSLENGKKYKNILSKVTNNNELFDKEDYKLILNKIKNKIFNEKISENLFGQQLDNIKNLQKIGNFDLILNSDKIDIINRTKNQINLILKLIHFEKNTLLRNTLSNNLKKKILIETSINIKKKIYLTKLIYFQKTASLNFETIFEKIQKHIIEQKIKQKKELLLISEKYENHYIKTLPLFNMDQNGKYLINYFSQLFDMQEMQIFKKLNQMDISFYPIELNKKIIKQKVIQMTTNWSNFIVIFKKIREFYQDNEITKNQYNILRYQTKQFIIKQLILNKNQIFIGSNDYLQFSQNNINYFINQIKTNINNSELNIKKQNHSEFFDFSLIQIYQKYNQLFNLLKTKEQFFSDESIKNHLYLNRLRKINLFDGSNLKNSNIQNYQSIYNNILKSYGLKYRKSYQKLSSNIMIKLSQNLAKWIENLSVLELKRGVSLLNKKQVITKPNSKLLISNLLQFKQNISKFINNSLSLNSVLILKGNNIYLQKSIQSFINLLTRLNLSINYKKLNSQFNYPMNINVQNQLNKKQYYQQYNQILLSQQQNQIINNFTNSFNNKLQILTDLNLFDFGIKIQFQKLLGKLTNEIHELNNLNQSMDETSYKTIKLVSQTMKLCNLFIYYHLKYLKKANKQDSQKNYKEKNYLKNELLTKLFSKITILKQQNLLTIPKYETLLDQLKQQQLTKQFVVNLFNEINLSKLEQLIESKFIYSDYIFYSKVQFFKFLTNYIILKERYEIKEIKNQKLINQIRIQLNQNFQNEFQYILYISKFSKLTQNGVLTNEQKDQIDYQLINILNTMKNFSKRSIKLQERLKYGFINYRKYETITQNLVQNLQFKIQKLINHSTFSEKTKMISLSNFNFNSVKILNFNISIKKIYSLHNTCWQQLQKLMYLILNSTKGVNMNKVDSNTLIFNYFKKELKVIEIRNIFKNIEKNANYLQDLKNKTKTRIISQTRKYYGALTSNSKSKIFRKNDKSVNKNKIYSVSQIKKAKNQQNLLQTSKLVSLKQFLYQIKNVIYNNFNQNSSIVAKISNSQLLLIRNFNLFNLNSLENLTLQTNSVQNYLNKLEVSIQLSKINNIHSKKYAFKIYQNLTYNQSNDKNPSTNLSLLSTNLDSMLLNIKINNISEILQKSYKYKILLNTQNETNKMVNSIRIEKLKASGLLSLKNTKLKTNQKIQELLHQLGDILIVSNYSNVSLISKYLKFELNLLKKSEEVEELNKYLRSKIHIISNKLSDLKNQSLIDSQKKYKQIKNVVLKIIFSQILISPNLDSLKDLIKTNLISPKLYIKIKKVFYRKKLITKLQNALFKLKQSSFNNSYEFKTIFPKLILVLEKFNDLKVLNLISNNQYNLIQTQIQQILKYEQFISHLILLKKQDIIKDIEYNQILLKIQQKIVQKVREQKIVQKFKQYIEYLYETKNTSQSSQKDQQESLNNKFKKIISLNQGKWALVAIKEFYQQNLLTNIQYNELVQKIETNIRKKIQLAKLFSNNRNTFKSTIYNKFMKSNYKIRQNQQNSKLLTSLPNIWTKNLLKELRKQSIISNNTYSQLEKEVISNNYLKTNKNQIDLILNQPTKNIKKYNRLKAKTIKDVELSIELLLNYKKQLLYWLSTIETTPINSDQLFDLSYLTNLKINKYINQKEYNKLKVSNQLATNRLLRLKTLQKGQSLNNLQYEKINQKILKSYLLTQFQYIQRLLRNKQSILQEFDYSSKNQKFIVGKTIKKHLNKIRNSKKLIKNPNSLYSLLQEVLSQLPISNTNKGQSTYRQRIIYNRLYSRLRSDETLIKKWKQILTKVLKKQLTPPLDIPPHLELKRVQISILPTNLTKKNKKHLIIPIGTVLNLPSRKTVGISVLERLIVEYYSRN